MKVVDFPKPEPDVDLIEMLEELLAEARGGSLKTLCCVGEYQDGEIFAQANADNYVELHGLLALAGKAL